MKIIIDSVDVAIEKAIQCVVQCIASKNKDYLWTFKEKDSDRTIVVCDKLNKRSITYEVYYECR